MALRKQPIVSAIGNENMGIMANGINIKNNLSNRTKPKQPLGNINNVIHNQIGRNIGAAGDIERKKKNLFQTNNGKSFKTSKIFQDEFDDFCSFKKDDKLPEQKWLEEEIANSRIFEKIIEADKPRTKRITKEELDWIEFWEFGENNDDIAKDIDLNESFNIPEMEIPKLSNSDFENLRAPSPNGLFDDLNITDIENISQNDNEIEAPTPIIASNFDDFNF